MSTTVRLGCRFTVRATARQEGAGGLFLDTHCALHLRAHIGNYRQAVFVRELPEKRRRTEVSVPYIGSAGAVGRHNKTPY
jgi:hypothetical protein